jgi:hypothetical protein
MFNLNFETMKKQIVKDQLILKVEELEERIAPAIVATNPAGNHPQSDSSLNGQAVTAQNPAGHAPPGQNK